jgi:hypothetical protein
MVRGLMGEQIEVLFVTVATTIFSPRNLICVFGEVRTCDVVVYSKLTPAQASKV